MFTEQYLNKKILIRQKTTNKLVLVVLLEIGTLNDSIVFSQNQLITQIIKAKACMSAKRSPVVLTNGRGKRVSHCWSTSMNTACVPSFRGAISGEPVIS